MLQISYERLLADFASIAAELFGFLEVDRDGATIELVRVKTDFESLSGRKRGEEDPASFFRKGVAGDWQGRLDERALDIIRGHCGKLIRLDG